MFNRIDLALSICGLRRPDLPIESVDSDLHQLEDGWDSVSESFGLGGRIGARNGNGCVEVQGAEVGVLRSDVFWCGCRACAGSVSAVSLGGGGVILWIWDTKFPHRRPQLPLSKLRYCMASAIWCCSMGSECSKSAMLRATFKIRS